MAIVLQDVLDLEKQRDELRKLAQEINESIDYTPQQKQKKIGEIADDIYNIDQEILRLKKMKPTVIVQESNKSVFVLAAGIVAIFLIMNRKK
jgi:adenylosuccinate synthase